MIFCVIGAHNQQVFLHVQMRKKINKNKKDACSSPISMEYTADIFSTSAEQDSEVMFLIGHSPLNMDHRHLRKID
jgi:hypothetical protein